MTTVSSTTSTTSTASAITALGAGSGMDVQSLATNLVEAERSPRKAVIEKKITQSESGISGYAAVKFVLNDLKTAFSGIKDQSDFNAMTTRVSQSSAMAVTTTATASTGSHSVSVTNLAKAQRSISGSNTSGFASPSAQLNGGVAFNLRLSKGNGPTPSKVFSQGTADVTTPAVIATKSTATVNFSSMTTGDTVTVNGLTLTANKNLTATEVGDLFAQLNTTNTADLTNLNTAINASGSFSGSFAAGFEPQTNANHVLILQSTANSVADNISVSSTRANNGTANAPTKTFSQGAVAANAVSTTGTKSTATLTFLPMAKGESVTVNGLTFTASTALAAKDVGEVFDQLTAANTADLTSLNAGMTAFGSFSGSFGAGYESELNNNGVLVLRSTANGAADIAAPTSFNTIEIGAASTTPAGMVAAINSSTLGISAQLINTGNAAAPYRIVITGATGASNSFSLSSKNADGNEVANVNFGTSLQAAENASLTVDGVSISSSTNKVTDAIAGTTLELFTTTSGAANLEFTRDTTAVKTNLKALVTAYNDANSMLSVVSDPKSTVETYGATLVGNSIVNSVRTQMRNMVTTSSNTPSGNMTALRDIGITLNRTGELEIDQVKMDAALQNNYDQVVTMLTANKQNQSTQSTLNGGVSNEAVKKLTSLLDASSPLTTQSTNLTTKISKYKTELDKLETRMTELLARYKKQFAAMESMVGETKSLQTGLKSTFEGMMATYTNK
jgi:flagellar capping protein FliD